MHCVTEWHTRAQWINQ